MQIRAIEDLLGKRNRAMGHKVSLLQEGFRFHPKSASLYLTCVPVLLLYMHVRLNGDSKFSPGGSE